MRPEALPDLKKVFDALDYRHKRTVQIALCRHALHVWEAYIQRQEPVEYVDSVVGMYHCVDSTLPRDALASVEAHSSEAAIAYRYQEPIAALQDDDLELPNQIELAYYAIYNLYRAASAGASIDDWLIITQALSAEENPEQWRILLADALLLVQR